MIGCFLHALSSSCSLYTETDMCMTVLQTDSAALAGMTENLWLEKACSNLIPALPLWIIEYAWSKRMMEVLEVLGPPLWLEGDWHVLTLDEPCRIRVVAAEVWRIVQARDIKHFERAMKFLDVTYMLKPKLVTPIKHMKILFGLKTLVIMWMLWNDQATAKISDKIEKLFPNSLPQYYKCNRRHMELMQKNGEDFKSFAHALAENRNMRKTYIRDLMEKQYGERYAQKLEERLSHYLGELDKALSQPTFIEQVLKQSYPQGRGEKILRKLLSEDTSLATNLKRLLHCAVTLQLSPDDSITPSLNSNTYVEQREGVKFSQGTLHVIVRPSQGQTQEDRLSQMRSKEICTSQCLWQNRGKGCTFPQESSEEICGDEALMTSIQMSSLLGPKINQIDCNPSMLEDQGEPIESSQQQGQERTGSERSDLEHTCSKHGKKMKSILRECSEEFDVENVQAECTPPSPQISPLLLSDTPQSDASQDTQNSASPHQHSLTTNTSVSTHQDSSSTNISMSYNQQITLSPLSTDQHPISTSITSPTGSVQLISTSSPSSLLQCSSSSTSTTSKQNNTPRINARHITDSTRQFLAAVVFTKRSEVTSRASGHELTLSLESQTFLMQCKWLQPQVRLHRLSREECFRSTDSCRTNLTSDEEQESEEEEYIPFDVNTLYSDTNSESTDSDDSDYIPNRD